MSAFAEPLVDFSLRHLVAEVLAETTTADPYRMWDEKHGTAKPDLA